MSRWSPSTRQRRLHRRAVPDGSFDFQRVLDELLSAEDSGAANNYREKYEREDEREGSRDWGDSHPYRYEDDFEFCDDVSDTGISGADNEGQITPEGVNNNNNNNNNDQNNNWSCCTCSCRLAECQPQNLDRSDSVRDVISPSSVLILDCLGSNLTDTQAEVRTSQKVIKLPHISPNKMGTSCSSNMYDRRDWHNVGQGSTTDLNKPSKRGRLLKKRSPEEDKKGDNSSVPSAVCTCQGQQDNNSTQDVASPTSCANDKRSMLSPNDVTESSGTQLTSNRLSPNVDSSGHIKVSRVVGSGRARATSSCDVSPHRLLTRRTNSPKGRTSSLEAHYAGTSQDLRQRSYSWSNGRIGTKTTYKSLSLNNRTSLSPTMGNHKMMSPQTTSNGPKSLGTKVTRTSSPAVTTLPQCSVTPAAAKTHDPTCPLYKSPDSTTSKQSSVKTPSIALNNIDDDLAPMTRRRAASESQTTRPRRLLPRTPDSVDMEHSPEHAHVHWADEEKGCSLSTCVFLSSIRPRSYSHGAMDNTPHRPILKKVTGF